MKYFSLLCFVLLFGITNYAQQIANVEFEQVDNKIIIYYDFEAYSNARYYVNIYCSSDDRQNWGHPLISVSGNVGIGQIPGTGKSIIWDVLEDRKKLTADVEFKIEAIASNDHSGFARNITYATYHNQDFHFSLKYPDQLFELSDDMIGSINDAPHNQQLGIAFESGFTKDESLLQPLILVYVQKTNHPSSFNKAISSITSSEIDLSGSIDAINEIIPVINDASIEKPVVDFENKIIISTAEMDYDFFGNVTKAKGVIVMFFGKEKIIQLNCVSPKDEFVSNLNNFFLPIIKNFEFDPGYTFVDEATGFNKIDKNSPLYLPGKDFMSGYTSKYICDGSGKGRGLKFSIKYPQSWKSQEGNRPHIVRKFSNEDMSAQVMILVNELEYIPSKQEIDGYFTTESAKQMIPTGGRYIKSNTTVIEGEKSLVIDYIVKREKLGTTFTGKYRMYSIFYKSYLLQVLFNVSQSPHKEPINLDEEFEKYEMLFNAMINSFSLISKWEDY